MAFASKFRPHAAAAPLSPGSPHTFQLPFSIEMPKRNIVPGARPKSKESSKGKPRSHLHRVRGPSCCSLKIAPCSLACSDAKGSRPELPIAKNLHLHVFQKKASWLGYLILNLGPCGSLLVLLVACLNLNSGLLGLPLAPLLMSGVLRLPFS